MTLTDSFQELVDKLECLRVTLEEFLQWAVTQGKPVDEDHVLVSRYDDATSDLIGLIEEARDAAHQGQQATIGQMDLACARLAQIACQERVNRVSQRFFSELVSFESLKALDSLAKERRKQWPQWVSGVKDALDRCRQPIDDVNQALFRCWQELTERASLVSVSLQTVSAGQQISVASERGDPTTIKRES